MKNSHIVYMITFILIILYLFRNRMTEQMKFSLIMAVILRHEGGYINDPDDPGGETKFGISKRSYPNLDIKNLTRTEAIEIYRRDYYLKMGIDKIENPNLAVQIMDFGVNAGTGTALKTLKTAVTESEKTGENIVKVYKRIRKNYYSSLAEKKPILKKFLAGWLNRIENSKIT